MEMGKFGQNSGATFFCKSPEEPRKEIVFWNETLLYAKFMYCT